MQAPKQDYIYLEYLTFLAEKEQRYQKQDQ